MHQNYFRDYRPELGRYLESDPIGLRGGVNLWGYAEASSIMYLDQLGLRWWSRKPPPADFTKPSGDKDGGLCILVAEKACEETRKKCRSAACALYSMTVCAMPCDEAYDKCIDIARKKCEPTEKDASYERNEKYS